MNAPNQVRLHTNGLCLGDTIAPSPILGRLWQTPSREIWLDNAQRTHIGVCGGQGTGESSLMRTFSALDMRKRGWLTSSLPQILEPT